MAISQAAAFTILSTESLLVYQNHSPSTGLAARQEEGLRALLRLVTAMETIVTSQEVNHSISSIKLILFIADSFQNSILFIEYAD